MGLYLLLDGHTGEPQALIDGPRLTQWRTACASALAASYLARQDASRLLVIGAGALCPFLAQGPFGGAADRRDPDLEPDAGQCRGGGRSAAQGRPRRAAVSDLDAALGEADIVSSRDDLDRARWSRARC